MLRTIGGIVAASSAVAATAAAAPAHLAVACPHDGTINGTPVLIACGPAKATLHFGSARLALKNGQCLRSTQNFGVDFGAAVAGPTSKPPPDSLQLIAGPHGGSATLQIARGGKQYIGETMKLKLNAARTAGSVTGVVTLASGSAKVAVSGTFTC